MTTTPDHPVRPAAAALLATAATFLALDLLWLGVVARGLYERALGDLLRPDAYLPAAALFYAFYVAVTAGWAVLGARSKGDAARRGAGLGFVAYATFELTSWAVIRGWPALLVPIDLAWGVSLTALAALAGRAAHDALRGRR
ncbi:MAG TPA: DUF2177 family protein [Thermoanaerobaculia bacterium]|nr:DUF2177 family protein [Thermoanaerobaculia bacterium]HQN06483.1 DUF2177 family protein [Thermoanaerobaculia bacterium]HQP84845.1 DUF2177 family protein [Thermoanaerobaculia bacterium]